MRNLTRNKAVTLRMTQEEFDFFQRQMNRAKQKTQTDFFWQYYAKNQLS
jgi:hypothetical protein